MTQELTTSLVARKNVLNNRYALQQLESRLALNGMVFEGETLFTKQQAAVLLDIDERTIDRYLSSHGQELEASGYRLLKGKTLKNIRLSHVDDIDVVHISPKTSALGVFPFRALLNLAMLVTESERAKTIRSRMLDIVLDTIAQQAGGHTKYINQRDRDYLPAAFLEDSYRKQFTSALSRYLDMGNHKYALYTDKIYQAVFCEKAAEYKKILRLADKEKTRDTMYAEVLNAISSFEHGLAEQLQSESQRLRRKLKPQELDALIDAAESSPFLRPAIEDARVRMASRDLGFRDALHQKLEHYIQSVPEADFERFLGEKSRSLQEQLADENTLNVLKRLRDR